MKKKLFFDSSISGHHSEYIFHLVDYLSGIDSNDIYFIVLHKEFLINFPNVFTKLNNNDKIIFYFLNDDELNECENGNLLIKSFRSFKVMDYYAKKCEVDDVFLMNFNPFQLSISFYRPKYSISGILFLQFYRMSRKNFFDNLRYYKKYFLTWLYTRNKQISSIFILNDFKAVEFLNTTFKTNIFKYLVDPIPEISEIENLNVHDYYNISQDKKIFLHFGVLGDRKGTFDILDSISLLDIKTQQSVALLLVGKPESDVVNSIILDKIERLKKTCDCSIVYDGSFVDKEFMKTLFNQCFSVLIPYKNSEASSGVLGHAIASRRPVIATNGGLLKEIIEKKNLGILISELTPRLISQSISILVADKKLSLSFANNESFVEEHSPNLFAKRIVD